VNLFVLAVTLVSLGTLVAIGPHTCPRDSEPDKAVWVDAVTGLDRQSGWFGVASGCSASWGDCTT
jgi:hypothetical protein